MAAEVKFEFPQPFTWAQVMDLDVGAISEGNRLTILTTVRSELIVQEITRLQHSLEHLKSTQDELQYLIDTTSDSIPDPEFIGAVQENVDVMYETNSTKAPSYCLPPLTHPPSNSQKERISILKHALAQKGVASPSHYDLDPNRSTQPVSKTANPELSLPLATGSGEDGLFL
jgi:hypothetical protein